MATEKEPWLEIIQDTEEYRDHIATVDEKGKRIWLFPKKPSGRFYNYRAIASFIFLAAFLIVPFIKVNGEQFMLFDVIHRKFFLFGVLFLPQDTHLFAVTMLTLFVFIILFTVVYGRIFCGWVCPQTVFMEMFFRRIEYMIEGDGHEQRKLQSAPWTAGKIWKKGLKHGIFFAISVVVANYFLAYIIGTKHTLEIINDPINMHLSGFIGMMVFSFVFYGIFAYLREQVCTTICPYGRLQGVLLVKETIVVAYDFLRGEPRGKMHKLASAAHTAPTETPTGDCIDCKLCIHVCPTGIDIRNGTQLECINCTACIDACDNVMDKISKPRGLIRYDSMKGIESGKRKIFTPRVFAYTGVLVALIILDIVLFANRSSIESIILRSPGQLYQMKDSTHITNLYTFKLINKTGREMPVEIRLATPDATMQIVGQAPGNIAKGEKAQGAFFVEMPLEKLTGRKTPLLIQVYSGNVKVDEVKTSFMGPGGTLHHKKTE